MTHTPGPWEIVHIDIDSYWVSGNAAPDPVTRARHLFVARVSRFASQRDCPSNMWKWPEPAEEKANARLIAAAPDLLAACERFGRWCEQYGPPEIQGVACDVFAAIAKATGSD